MTTEGEFDSREVQVYTFNNKVLPFQEHSEVKVVTDRLAILTHERLELRVYVERLVLEAHKLAVFKLRSPLSESGVAEGRVVRCHHGGSRRQDGRGSVWHLLENGRFGDLFEFLEVQLSIRRAQGAVLR